MGLDKTVSSMIYAIIYDKNGFKRGVTGQNLNC
jgi:hypothetical protein